MQKQLTPEQMESLRQAKDPIEKLSEMGLTISENIDVTKQPTAQESKTYENFIDINGSPSRNHFYPCTVQGQSMKVEDLLLIQSITPHNSQGRYNEIFSRRLRGIDSSEILVGDELYFAFWLRESSFPGQQFPNNGYTCHKCKLEIPDDMAYFYFNHIKFESNIDELIKLYGNKDYIEFNLPSGKPCKQYIMRRKHIDKVNYLINRDYFQKNIQPPEDLIDLLTILSVFDFGIPDLYDTLNAFQQFSALDFMDIMKRYKKYNLNTKMSVNLECPSPECKEVTSLMEYPFRYELCFPDYD
jgi:hypothetical protein